jgi:hypothetical protein
MVRISILSQNLGVIKCAIGPGIETSSTTGSYILQLDLISAALPAEIYDVSA